jgi:hypothetical protein
MFENQPLNKHVMGSDSEESSSHNIAAFQVQKIFPYRRNDKKELLPLLPERNNKIIPPIFKRKAALKSLF